MSFVGNLVQSLKPTDEEIRRLAHRETDPEEVGAFTPVARGPVVAIVALGLVAMAAAPFCVIRACRSILRRPGR